MAVLLIQTLQGTQYGIMNLLPCIISSNNSLCSRSSYWCFPVYNNIHACGQDGMVTPEHELKVFTSVLQQILYQPLYHHLWIKQINTLIEHSGIKI